MHKIERLWDIEIEMKPMFIFSIILGVFIGIILSDYLKYKNAYSFLDKSINNIFLYVKLFLLKQKKKIIFCICTTLSFITILFIYDYKIQIKNEQEFKELREKYTKQQKEKQISFCEKIKNINIKETSIDNTLRYRYEYPRFWIEKKYRDERRYYIEILEKTLSDIHHKATPPHYDEYYDCFDLDDGRAISWKKGVKIICK